MGIRVGWQRTKGGKKKVRRVGFLQLFQAVDFRKAEADPLEQLVWGITGERDGIKGREERTPGETGG